MPSTEQHYIISGALKTAIIQIIETCRTDFQVRDIISVLQAINDAPLEGIHADILEVNQPE